MKKFIAILTVVMLVAASFTTVAFADEAPAKAEVLFPERVFMATPQSLVKTHKILISDADTTGLAENPTLRAVNTMDGKYIKSRTIHTMDEVTESTSANIGDTRIRMTGDWDGTFRYKRPFTYEFDFTVNKLDHYLTLKIQNAELSFVRDTATDDEYCLSWGVNDMAEISGKVLKFGKTYNLRIEADMVKGGKIFTVFTDPETGEFYTSSVSSEVTATEEQLATLTNRYYVIISFQGRVEVVTDNEMMLYESYFVRGHELTFDTLNNKIVTKVTLLNALNKARTSVPALNLAVYDANGSMVECKKYDDVPEVGKQSGEGGEKLDAPLFTYSASIDVSNLEDGEYTAKSFLWRSDEEMYVIDEGVTQAFTVKEGKIVE